MGIEPPVRRRLLSDWEILAIAIGVGFGSWLLYGCTLHVGVDGLDGSLFGSHYHHRETFSEPGEGSDGGYLKSWSTVGGRTFGTVDLEWKTDESSEKGSMRGEGMSSNLQRTLGDDTIKSLGEDAKCVLMPALCIGAGAAVSEFLGDDTPILEDEPIPTME